jgi:hypothetical protein
MRMLVKRNLLGQFLCVDVVRHASRIPAYVDRVPYVVDVTTRQGVYDERLDELIERLSASGGGAQHGVSACDEVADFDAACMTGASMSSTFAPCVTDEDDTGSKEDQQVVVGSSCFASIHDDCAIVTPADSDMAVFGKAAAGQAGGGGRAKGAGSSGEDALEAFKRQRDSDLKLVAPPPRRAA